MCYINVRLIIISLPFSTHQFFLILPKFSQTTTLSTFCALKVNPGHNPTFTQNTFNIALRSFNEVNIEVINVHTGAFLSNIPPFLGGGAPKFPFKGRMRSSRDHISTIWKSQKRRVRISGEGVGGRSQGISWKDIIQHSKEI